MKTKTFLEVIKEKLEKKGTKFGEHYGDLIYASGYKDSRFFERISLGEYSVEVLRIPEEFYTKTLDKDKVEEFLNE